MYVSFVFVYIYIYMGKFLNTPISVTNLQLLIMCALHFGWDIYDEETVV